LARESVAPPVPLPVPVRRAPLALLALEQQRQVQAQEQAQVPSSLDLTECSARLLHREDQYVPDQTAPLSGRS
jgi:hypothetical protein